MKICYIGAGERGPLDLRYGHQKAARPKTGTSHLGVSIKTLFMCVFYKDLHEKINSRCIVKRPLVPNVCQGWGIFDIWHEVPVFKHLPLGTELAVVVCHSSGENPVMSAIWEKINKKESVAWVKSLKKKIYFLFVAHVYGEPAGTCVDNPASCWWNQLTSGAVWSIHVCECMHDIHSTHAYLLPCWKVQCLKGSSSQRKVNHIVHPPPLISRLGPFSCHLCVCAMVSE